MAFVARPLCAGSGHFFRFGDSGLLEWLTLLSARLTLSSESLTEGIERLTFWIEQATPRVERRTFVPERDTEHVERLTERLSLGFENGFRRLALTPGPSPPGRGESGGAARREHERAGRTKSKRARFSRRRPTFLPLLGERAGVRAVVNKLIFASDGS